MKARYKIDTKTGLLGFRYCLFKRIFWCFWRQIKTSYEIKELEEELKEIKTLPKYFN